LFREFYSPDINEKSALIRDFLNLLIPVLCPACGNTLVKNERIICTTCLFELPRTRYCSYTDNPVGRLFWGRVYVEYTTALFKYQKGSRFQSLIHELKYRNRKDIGKELGRLLGIELAGSPYTSADMILPVPLHRKKYKQRGYNQCHPIAEGLSESLRIPWHSNHLIRPSTSLSQTIGSRLERWSNVDGIFEVKDPGKICGKHIILVDDVVTTGATLDACATSLLSHDKVRVSVVTLAVALKLFN
jgi:ComF family protein